MPKAKNTYRNNYQDRRLEQVESHIITINEEIGDVKVKIAEIKSDTCWLKKTYWVIVMASVGGLIGAFINLLIK